MATREDTSSDPDEESWESSDVGKLLGSVLVFNVLDAVATISWLQMGMASEANPMMVSLLELHPAAFAAVKIALVSLGVLLLWRYREHRLAVVAAHLLFVVFTLVICYHIFGGLLTA